MKKLATAGIGAFALAAGLITFGAATANAEVEEVAPGPEVRSRQASVVSDQWLRIVDPSVARGLSQARLADAGEINAQGESRDSTKAVNGTTAEGFEGPWAPGPGMGDW
ncbi:hypothetical protein MCHIJ_23800 [Mycolicibacterium chitae]|uniref:Secreted protein n=1 Tax=Mycolicibacterium chitae TaxID=1792 RepID=A0A3S4RK33_MYCCI|nr:hypothetical protein [Mycolicibacterium chitae]MCV7107651.1 hypothetical protein [Mycolicibacterium chitae]BBZ02943.1 hypothetical protein MCHIJ_23800 [Mycolicibacterium chitae]VEG45994.1 Uncharacterised protein [Mycolicibacterium chitae]